MKLTGKSIALVNDFLNKNNDMNEILKKLKHNPNSFEAKTFRESLKIFLKLLVDI